MRAIMEDNMATEHIRRIKGLADGSGKRQEWIIQTYHHTGLPIFEDQCPRYYSREAAREALRERRRQYAALKLMDEQSGR